MVILSFENDQLTRQQLQHCIIYAPISAVTRSI